MHGCSCRKTVDSPKVIARPILVYYKVYENKRLIEVLHFRHGAETAAIRNPFYLKLESWNYL